MLRIVRVFVLLGLAGLAWKKFGPKVMPVARDAAAKLQSASRDGAESVRDASLSVADASMSVAETADTVAHAIGDPDPTEHSSTLLG
jgi:hypothetical protein